MQRKVLFLLCVLWIITLMVFTFCSEDSAKLMRASPVLWQKDWGVRLSQVVSLSNWAIISCLALGQYLNFFFVFYAEITRVYPYTSIQPLLNTSFLDLAMRHNPFSNSPSPLTPSRFSLNFSPIKLKYWQKSALQSPVVKHQFSPPLFFHKPYCRVVGSLPVFVQQFTPHGVVGAGEKCHTTVSYQPEP